MYLNGDTWMPIYKDTENWTLTWDVFKYFDNVTEISIGIIEL